MTFTINIYELKDYIDKIIREDHTLGLIHLTKKKHTSNWRNNHKLCIANYERMKASRKRIIKQRDKLQAKLDKQQELDVNLRTRKQLTAENKNLIHTLHQKEGEISRLQTQLERNRVECFESKRKYSLLKSQLKQMLEGE